MKMMSDGVRVDDFPVWADNIPMSGTVDYETFLRETLDGMSGARFFTR